MIPVSSNHLGWSLFFTDAKPISMAEVSSKNGSSGGGQSAGGDRSGKLFLLMVISKSSGILKNLEQFWGRTGFLESLQ